LKYLFVLMKRKIEILICIKRKERLKYLFVLMKRKIEILICINEMKRKD